MLCCVVLHGRPQQIEECESELMGSPPHVCTQQHNMTALPGDPHDSTHQQSKNEGANDSKFCQVSSLSEGGGNWGGVWNPHSKLWWNMLAAGRSGAGRWAAVGARTETRARGEAGRFSDGHASGAAAASERAARMGDGVVTEGAQV